MTPTSRRRIIRTGIGLLVLYLAVVLWGWMTSWRRLPYFEVDPELALASPIMSGAAYGEVIDTHPRPCVFRVEAERGAVLIYGAEHTKDPADPALDGIRREWKAFGPTVALCESRLGVLFPQFMDPVREFGEPGLVHALARERDIPTYTWEPTPAVFMAHLLRQPFTKEQLALRLKLGACFSNLRHGRPDDPAAFLADAIGDGTKWPGLENTLPTAQDIDREWKRQFPDGPDWRDVSDQFGLPGFLADIETNAPRDEHFARVVVTLARQGHRVFAIAGSSHAVKLEAALRDTLETVTLK